MTGMCDTCDDSRFELIEKYKQKLLDATNIEDSPEEMAVIDNILLRFWQMGWLKGELFGNSEQLDCSDCVNHGGDWDCDHVHCHIGTGTITDSISRAATVEALNEYFSRIGKLKRRGLSNAEKAISLDTVGAIKALPPAQQWIPCTPETMPKVREWVLCQCRAGIMDVLRLTEDGSWNKNYPYAEYMSGFVIAWMPLPDSWEGEQNE